MNVYKLSICNKSNNLKRNQKVPKQKTRMSYKVLGPVWIPENTSVKEKCKHL